MQYALPQVLPDVPAGGVCAGIDWATADHAVCVVDMAGRVTGRRVYQSRRRPFLACDEDRYRILSVA